MLSWQSKRNSLRDKLESGSSFSPLQTRLVAPQRAWQTAAFGMPQESVNPVTSPSCDCNVSQLGSGILKKNKKKNMQIYFNLLAAGRTEKSCDRKAALLCILPSFQHSEMWTHLLLEMNQDYYHLRPCTN